MKAIIWIIILALVAWGAWTWLWPGSTELNGQEAQVGGALDDIVDDGSDSGASTDDDIDLSEFEDKG